MPWTHVDAVPMLVIARTEAVGGDEGAGVGFGVVGFGVGVGVGCGVSQFDDDEKVTPQSVTVQPDEVAKASAEIEIHQPRSWSKAEAS